MIKKNKGFTVIESIIACSIFAFISVVLFACFSNGQKFLKESSAKLENERSINLSTQDINFSIRNSAIDEIVTSNETYNGTGYIAISNASRYDANSGGIINNDLDYTLSGTASQINWNFKIVYFTAKLPHCQKCIDMGLTSSNLSICPHKYLVKRYYTLNDIEENSYIKKWSEVQDNIDSLCIDSYEGNNKHRYDKILAHNVISFLTQKADNKIIYSIKLLKEHNLVKNAIKTKELQQTITAHKLDLENMGLKLSENAQQVQETNTETQEVQSIKDPLYRFTSQINYTATPLNNN